MTFNLWNSKIRIALILIILIITLGAIGFRITMDLGWVDSIYMTVITITTVGYREIGDPSQYAKIFIILLILCSVVIVGYGVSAISEYLLSKERINSLREKRKMKHLEKLKDHVIVCGYGRNGKQAIEKLLNYNRDFLIIEQNQEVIDSCDLDHNSFIRGNAVEDSVLLEARIKEASTLITALPEDADNLFIVLSARQLNKDLKIISRASEDTTYKKLKLAGADHVVLPDTIGGQHMASLIVNPDLIEFWENVNIGGTEGVNLEQVSFEQMFDEERDCTIVDLDLRQETGCTIIGYKSPDGSYVVNPDPNMKLCKGSKIIVVGNTEQIEKLQKVYRIQHA
ncbi:MAG: potassium channel protein [Nonlabens sp.]